MPGRLVGFIVILLLIGTLIGFNIGNSSDIRVWFGEKGIIEDVPILLSFFIVYIFGLMSSIPFYIGRKLKQLQNNKKNKPAAVENSKQQTEPIS